MHLVFTHEQADFDAIASLWAVPRLDPEAVAVRPSLLSPNVHHYLTLYGEHFSFADLKELKLQQPIRLTLVDTQSPPTVELSNPQPSVQVIDHHPKTSGLNPGWSVQIEPVGATSTLLIEALIGKRIQLTVEGATLMLLGIYEATGSLAHPGTTARDARAAAWLLEQGASLAVGRDFLNPLRMGQLPESPTLTSDGTALVPEDARSRPPDTVAGIMSRGPQLLRPSLTVGQAADQMRRFGHEGYPVTDAGQVVGLLTRRAVDRAMAHGMQARPVSEIMDAGSLVVHPDDTVRHLQQLMVQHQWGQVPVADLKSGEIIGIVTRTDLLNSLSGGTYSNGPVSLAARLERALPAGRLALLKLIASEAERTNSALYLVGGFVRDLQLDSPPADFDLVFEGDAIRLATTLVSKYGGKVSSHHRFGTAKWRLDSGHPALVAAIGSAPAGLPETLDLVSARTEFYPHPSALPSVTEGSIKLDLHRRDFSVNTLALRLDGDHFGELLDYWGGGRDLAERQIRVLHSLSFVDDPTRMLRAVLLEQRLGFSIESRTMQLIEHALPLLDSVSGERIRAELADILVEGQANRIMARLAELGLLRAIHPGLGWDSWMEARFSSVAQFEAPPNWRLAGRPPAERLKYALWLYRLPRQDAELVCARLAFSQADRSVVVSAGRHGCGLSDGRSPSQIVACLESVPEDALVAEWLAAEAGAEAKVAIERFLAEWRWVRQRTDGHRLQELGLPAGPAYGQILTKLREAWLDGRIRSEAEEHGLLKLLVEEYGGGG